MGKTLKQITAEKMAKLKQQKQAKAKAAKEKKALALKKANNLKVRKHRLKKREQDIKDWEADSENLKDKFYEAFTANKGQLGISLTQVGLSRVWYRKMLTEDTEFADRMTWTLDDLEEAYIAQLYKDAMEGDTKAGNAYFRRSQMLKANITYKHRIAQLQIQQPSLDKMQALKFAVTELLTTYYSLKSTGRDTQALYAIRQYIEVLQLTEVSDLGEYEILKGTKLIEIMDAVGVKPSDIEDIKYEELPEDMQQHYKDMFPQDNLNGKDNKEL